MSRRSLLRRVVVSAAAAAAVGACLRQAADPTTTVIGDAREPFDAGPDFSIPEPPPGPDPGPDPDPQPLACTAVDVLFAIDDSGPDLVDDQAWIRETLFPSLGATIWEVGDGLDSWRMGVTDACPTPAGLHTGGATDDCGLHDGVRWVDGAWEDWLDHGACVLDVQAGANTCTGEDDDEQPATSAARALNPPDVDEVNAGFLRDDALLVIVAVTDEDEQPTPVGDFQPTIEVVHEYLLRPKGDDDRRVVFVGMGGGEDCAEGPLGPHGDAVNLRALVELFGARGIFLDTCHDLGGGPSAVLGVIDAACKDMNDG